MIADFGLFPPVTVVVCTYNRPVELQATLRALDENLYYPARREKVRVVIADDCSPDGYMETILGWPVWKHLGQPGISRTNVNSGWGANVNGALAHVDTDLVLFLEDDYVLKKPLNLGLGVTFMLKTPDVGLLRYGGIAGGSYVLHMHETDVSDYLPDYRDGMGLPGKATYFLIDSSSPDLYLYSNTPHLKRRAFHEFYGPYHEGRKLGHTEESFAHIVKDKIGQPGAPSIAVLPHWIVTHFDHIGHSYQHTEADVTHAVVIPE